MTRAPKESALTVDGPAGPLEARLSMPDGTPSALAVVCHPHPLHHGTMDNKIVHTLVRTFAAHGFAALRFNFRGVGASGGRYDDGVGEVDDALAAVAALRARHGGLPLWMAGFSFGSGVALRAAMRVPCAGLVMVAPPAARLDVDLGGGPGCRWLVVQGDVDDVSDPDAVIGWVNEQFPGPELVMLPGVGHYFHGRLNALRDTVAAFLGDA